MPLYHNAYYPRDVSPPPSPLLDPVPPPSTFLPSPKTLRSPAPSEEFVEQYESCPAAAKACCRFVERESDVDPHELKLYRRQLPGSDRKGLVIGVAVQASAVLQPIVVIENDTTGESGRGIYFTGTAPDTPRSLVACLRKSAQLHPVYRHVIYMDYCSMLQNRSPQFIWDWWKTGLDMDGLDDKIREGL